MISIYSQNSFRIFSSACEQILLSRIRPTRPSIALSIGPSGNFTTGLKRCYGTKRVVVTGMGIVSPLGVGVQKSWNELLRGACGAIHLSDPAYENIPCKIAACIPEDELNSAADELLDPSSKRVMNRSSIISLICADEAIRDSGLLNGRQKIENSTEIGVSFGQGLSDLNDISTSGALLGPDSKGYRKLSPHFITRVLLNTAAGYISIKYGTRGPCHSVTTACTTGAHSIGDALNFIRMDTAKVMLAGSVEANVNPLSLAGFSRIRALTTEYNKDPEKSSRPFDLKRSGFLMGEGAAVMILEELEHALERKAPHIYAELVGYGVSSDAYHLTAPSSDGDGAYRCMENSIKDSRLHSPTPIDRSSVGYINAHATSTPLGDEIELKAIQHFFSDTSSPIVVSSFKGSIGHLLGAAGSAEAVLTVKSIYSGIVPPTTNLKEPIPHDSNVTNLIRDTPIEWNSPNRIAITNSFGFGGTNASLIFRSYPYIVSD